MLLSFSVGAPSGRTGAPDELSCSASGCHGSDGNFEGKIEIYGFPSSLIPGQTFDISISVIASQGNPIFGGMSSVALGRENGTLVNIGEWIDPGSDVAVDDSPSNGRLYLSHSPAKLFAGNDTVTYTANWQSPNAFNTDTVTIYTAAVLANGNGLRSGDNVIFNRIILPVVFMRDEDMDGFASNLDCDDNNPNVNPGQQEIINNDIDENCDGIIEEIDEDMDGFNAAEDCDDFNSAINPIALEIINNDIDENCDGIIAIRDEDNDGVNSNDDCDDNNPNVFPNAIEVPNNGIDEDCDGSDLITQTSKSGIIVDFNDQPIGGVELTNNIGDVIYTTTSTGGFEINIEDPEQRIAFRKEATAAQGISSTDLVLTINHIIDIRPFTHPLQTLAADVNNSNDVTAIDLVMMRRVILQDIDGFGDRPSWNFIPEFVDLESFENIDTIRAYKIGDVNGSASRL